MGLDMYLNGVEGDDVETELGYWRKHPDLHGFIVGTFASGVDECQKIPLTTEDIALVLAAVTKDILPTTTGFFFGVSSPEDKDDTLRIFHRALDWMSEDPARQVFYQASW
jgi:hypothetical protein